MKVVLPLPAVLQRVQVTAVQQAAVAAVQAQVQRAMVKVKQTVK